MRTLKLRLPDTLELNDFDITMMIASQLYENCKLSLGEAAKMVGVSKETFMELLGHYGVSVFSTSVSDLREDIANA